jgi:hypothetical protein
MNRGYGIIKILVEQMKYNFFILVFRICISIYSGFKEQAKKSRRGPQNPAEIFK